MKRRRSEKKGASGEQKVRLMGHRLSRDCVDILTEVAARRGISRHALVVDILEAEAENLEARARRARQARKAKQSSPPAPKSPAPQRRRRAQKRKR